jgi:hypothetical protein
MFPRTAIVPVLCLVFVGSCDRKPAGTAASGGTGAPPATATAIPPAAKWILDHPGKSLSGVAFAKGGQVLVTVDASGSSKLRVWDLKTGQEGTGVDLGQGIDGAGYPLDSTYAICSVIPDPHGILSQDAHRTGEAVRNGTGLSRIPVRLPLTGGFACRSAGNAWPIARGLWLCGSCRHQALVTAPNRWGMVESSGYPIRRIYGRAPGHVSKR